MKNKIYEEEIRKKIESGKLAILEDCETSPKTDKLRHLQSGLTPVLARRATHYGTAIGINIDALKMQSKEEKAQRLARIRQNIKLTRKAKTKIALRDRTHEGHYLLLSLGASTQQAADARTQSF